MPNRRTQLLLACASWIALAARATPPRPLELVRFQPGAAARGASWVSCAEGGYWSPWRERAAEGYSPATPRETDGQPAAQRSPAGAGRVQDYVDLGR